LILATLPPLPFTPSQCIGYSSHSRRLALLTGATTLQGYLAVAVIWKVPIIMTGHLLLYTVSAVPFTPSMWAVVPNPAAWRCLIGQQHYNIRLLHDLSTIVVPTTMIGQLLLWYLIHFLFCHSPHLPVVLVPAAWRWSNNSIRALFLRIMVVVCKVPITLSNTIYSMGITYLTSLHLTVKLKSSNFKANLGMITSCYHLRC
jgi:hypothetical protein